ncbi:MAG: aminobenzoyl-glutamate utilization protein B [Cyclobacteriaceae bacterium]|jgi:aminobenzoyl-glutamate utilization protein B
MTYRFLLPIALLITAYTLQAQKATKAVLSSLDEKSEQYAKNAMQIWDWAEVGYQEEKSSQLHQGTLEAAGFKITSGVADIPTAFIAEYGSGEPVIAILAEYDALPGVSQKAIPEKSPVVVGGAGHACGHHLFGTGSVAAGIAVKEWIMQNNIKGTIRVYGTPAEEGGAGKVYMVRAGLFDDVDVVLHWHPSSSNGANPGYSLANKSAKFRFYGEASHAAAAPERGRSALDGVEAMNHMVNLLREHVPSDTRIHYVITSGGEAPNVVPAFAEVFYYVRNPKVENVKTIFEKVVNAAEGAAMGTQTEMDYEVIHGLYNLLPNETLAKVMHSKLSEIGGVPYDADETAFAKKIQESYSGDYPLANAGIVQPYSNKGGGSSGSTDVGDVSWMVPTTGMGAATWVPGTSAHTWQAVAAGGTTIGTKAMMVAAKTITLTAMEIFKNPQIADQAKAELAVQRGENFIYDALIGDREPPLDYRK